MQVFTGFLSSSSCTEPQEAELRWCSPAVGVEGLGEDQGSVSISRADIEFLVGS